MREQLVELQRRVEEAGDLDEPVERADLLVEPALSSAIWRSLSSVAISSSLACRRGGLGLPLGHEVLDEVGRDVAGAELRVGEDLLVEGDRGLHAAPRDLELARARAASGRSRARGRAPRRSASRSASRRTG